MSGNKAPLTRYYGRYRVGNQEVALLELERAQEVANSQSRLYGNLANILAVVTAALSTVLLSDEYASLWSTAHVETRMLVFWAVIVFFGFLVLQYFAALQKTITLSARKAITLRRALGLDYSPLQLTLPASRLEGANNPFAVRLFPGWSSITTYPVWVVALLTVGVSYLSFRGLEFHFVPGSHDGITIGLLLAIGNAWAFRGRLSEEHETALLRTIYGLARLLRVKVLPSFPYVLFRAKLAAAELRRIGVDTSRFKQYLVIIEDNRYYQHRGVCLRGLIRATLSQVRFLRKKFGWAFSGGSTLPMQLARTLLIADYQKTVRRKVLEVPLGLWIDRQFSKDKLLDIYSASVRFARGVYGLSAAIDHYFDGGKEYLTKAEVLFLVERLSNVNNIYRENKVKAQLERLNSSVENPIGWSEVEQLYTEQITTGNVEEV